jgi:hypothetical protein
MIRRRALRPLAGADKAKESDYSMALRDCNGIVTFANLICQPQRVLEDRVKKNQRLGELVTIASPLENFLFLASLTMPIDRFLRKVTESASAAWRPLSRTAALAGTGGEGRNAAVR